jgi:hypothetical protein
MCAAPRGLDKLTSRLGLSLWPANGQAPCTVQYPQESGHSTQAGSVQVLHMPRLLFRTLLYTAATYQYSSLSVVYCTVQYSICEPTSYKV